LQQRAFRIINPYIAQIAMGIPQMRLQDALDALREQAGGQLQAVKLSPSITLQSQLSQLLQQLGWESLVVQGDGSVLLTGFTGRELDLANDPVLVGAAGIVAPGSFLMGQPANALAPTWWISYTEQEKVVHSGTPTEQQVVGLLVCPACGSLNPRDWHHVQYTAIRYPVSNVNPAQIETVSQGEVVYESVIKAYLECACGAEIARGGREIV
jgi:hypothetical protein